MSTNQDLAIQQKATTLKNLLDVSKKQIEAALPKHLSPDRLLRIALTEARKNPALLDCTQTSFLGAIIQTAQLGLEPGGALGHAYLVPFKNKDKQVTEVQLIVGYRGMIDLAYRSPLVDHVVARPVYDTDKFSYKFGLDESLEHIPDPLAAGTKLTHVYFIVFLKTGGKLFDVMTHREVEMARARSKSPDKGPWDTDYEAMALKSIVRKFSKYTPLSIELQMAANLDEAGDRGEQDNGSVIETTGKTVDPKTQAPPAAFTDSIKKTAPPAAGKKTEPAPTFGEDDQGGFANFNPGPIIKPKVLKTREELVAETMKAAEMINLDIKKLSARSRKEFKKDLNSLTDEEIQKLIDGLNEEFQRMSVK